MDPRQTTPPPGPDAGDPPEGGPWNGPEWDWSQPYTQPPRRPPLPDLTVLLTLLDSLRRLIPPELQEQFGALQRELLLTVRGVIDWQLERLESRAQVAEVEDIPIE